MKNQLKELADEMIGRWSTGWICAGEFIIVISEVPTDDLILVG